MSFIPVFSLVVLLVSIACVSSNAVPWNIFLKQQSSTNSDVQDIDLNEFCSNKAEGFYCHPNLNDATIYCSMSRQIQRHCPSKTTCRSHSKLSGIEHLRKQLSQPSSGSAAEEDSILFNEEDDWLLQDREQKATTLLNEGQFAQCVAEDSLDLDSYCEDELYNFYLTKADQSWLGTKEEQELVQENVLKYDLDTTVIGAIRLCNPFHIGRKQSLQCLLLKKECGNLLDSGDLKQCLPSQEVVVHTEECKGFGMCRLYKEEDPSKKHSSQCRTPLDSMCLDRFYSIYFDGFMKQLSEISLVSFRPFMKTIEFKFCDPFRVQKQLECQIEWRVSPLPALIHQSILPPYEKENMKYYIRKNFPILYKKLYPAPLSPTSEDFVRKQYSLLPKRIHVIHHFCPENLTLLPGDERSESISFSSGPVCRQYSRFVSRCSPRTNLKPGIDDSSEFVFDGEDENYEESLSEGIISLADRISHHVIPETFSGFCVGKSPGQYCIPGTPEIGVLCPGGKTVRCRKASSSRAITSDLDGGINRCIQQYGLIDRKENTGDPFRAYKVIYLNGTEILYGPWATCGK